MVVVVDVSVMDVTVVDVSVLEVVVSVVVVIEVAVVVVAEVVVVVAVVDVVKKTDHALVMLILHTKRCGRLQNASAHSASCLKIFLCVVTRHSSSRL